MRHILSLLLLLASMAMSAQTAEWQPIKVWPFVYEKFTDAVIYTHASGQVVKAKANVHVGHAALWYESKGQRLTAKLATVKRVVFKGGQEYRVVADRLVEVLRTDTVDGKVMRLMMAPLIDKQTFDEQARAHNSLNNLVADGGFAGMQDLANSVRDNEGIQDFDHMPLPMRPVFYGEIDGQAFELTHGNILKHMHTRQERSAYGAYVRKAEVFYNSRTSMENVWNTFFVK